MNSATHDYQYTVKKSALKYSSNLTCPDKFRSNESPAFSMADVADPNLGRLEGQIDVGTQTLKRQRNSQGH